MKRRFFSTGSIISPAAEIETLEQSFGVITPPGKIDSAIQTEVRYPPASAKPQLTHSPFK